METLCTACCKDKDEREGLLPAAQRYRSDRIEFVHGESKRLGKPFLILSGKYGLIDADLEIPWYDQSLEASDVEAFVPLLTEQLRTKGVSRIVFHGPPRTTPGWAPYYDALEQACDRLGIPVAFRWTDRV